MRAYTKFYITPKGERAARSGHPWVYAEEITNIEGEYRNGDLVDVVTNKGKYLGTGFVNDHIEGCFCNAAQYAKSQPHVQPETLITGPEGTNAEMGHSRP